MADVMFRDMTKSEFVLYLEWTAAHYADCIVRSGGQTDLSAAEKVARAELRECLPDGFDTADTFFYIIENENSDAVGLLVWQEDTHEKGVAFILDILIYEEYRRHGYASAAVKKLFCTAKEHGYKKCRLNVFNFNTSAKSVYEKCGMNVEKEFKRSTLMAFDL